MDKKLNFKKSSQILAFTFILTASLASCKKEDPGTNSNTNNNKPKTLTEMLTTGKWLEIDARDPNGSVWNQVPACTKDDYTIFKVGGAYEYDMGALKCNPSDPQIKPGTGTWKFNSTESKLTIGSLDYQIEELTDSKLTLLLSGPGYQLTTFYIKK